MTGIPIPEMRERFLKLFSGALNDVLRFEHQHHASSLPSCYKPLKPGMRMCGRAFTVKGGPDITTDGEFEQRAQMLEDLHQDSVVVWDCTGDTVTAQWGEVMTMAAMRAGCRGAIINGVRDVDPVLDQEFPVFHQYTTSTGMLGRFRMYHYQKPVLMGEVVVNPGDWIFADADGALAIPQAIAEAVLISAEAILAKEKDIKDMVRSGMKPTEVVKNGGYF
ncbi:MAG: RraA family protein [Planctomycetota bacterium]|jgi:4-hydroxy-4-methyl-2-oxoglutarate aldolase|nr:RraA family protein [Planctomycetota bacterium]